MISKGCIFEFFQVVLNWKVEQILRKLPIINQVLTDWTGGTGITVLLPGVTDAYGSLTSWVGYYR